MKRNIEMMVLRTAAFLLPVAGLGGIAGAAETGTSPGTAIVAFLIGSAAFAECLRQETSPCRVKEKIIGKEREMSGLEHEELERRMQGMTKEEQILAARALPESILLEELCRRYADLRKKVDSISRVMEEENGRR